jgi:hypothetical protein
MIVNAGSLPLVATRAGQLPACPDPPLHDPYQTNNPLLNLPILPNIPFNPPPPNFVSGIDYSAKCKIIRPMANFDYRRVRCLCLKKPDPTNDLKMSLNIFLQVYGQMVHSFIVQF